jgi:SSS family solute:Na+ symporter
MKDFIESRRQMTSAELMKTGKITTVLWGAAITGFAFLVGNISGTIVEAINKIGSCFYGPILAAFLTGVLSKRVNEQGVIAGVLAGVTFNVALWLGAPGLYWMWWNAIGLVVASGVAYGVSLLFPPPPVSKVERHTLTAHGVWQEEKQWLGTYAVLIGYFVVILCCVLFADDILA